MSNGERDNLDFAAPAVVSLWQRRAMIVGCVFAVPSIIGWILDSDQFYRSYLLGYMFCFELTVGSLALLMLYHLTGGAWGTVVRRVMEAAMQNIWLMLILFAPIIIGVHRLYPWSRPEELAGSEHLRFIAHQYLRLGLWIPRAALYFIAFIALILPVGCGVPCLQLRRHGAMLGPYGPARMRRCPSHRVVLRTTRV